MKRLLAANWKMNHLKKDARKFCKVFLAAKKDKDIDFVIAPPFTLIEMVAKTVRGSGTHVAAQNVSCAARGAYTGEVSAEQAADAGADFCIIGHSERRNIFNESDDMLNKKTKKALANDLKVIFCIGEKLNERNMGKTLQVLDRQLTAGLKDIDSLHAHMLTIAYEPVWAIGTGMAAEVSDIVASIKFIKEKLKVKFGKNADPIRVLYGGSVTPENSAKLFKNKVVDGALVGGASLNAEKFLSIAEHLV